VTEGAVGGHTASKMACRSRLRLALAALSWTLSCGGVASPSPASVAPDASADPSIPVVLASGIRANEIVVDARGLYVANATPGGGGSVLMLAKTDGAATELASNLRTPYRLASDDTTLFVGTGEGVQTVPKAGGALVTVASMTSFDALDRSFLYRIDTFTGDLEHPKPTVSKLLATPTTGGSERVVLTSDVGFGSAVGADDSGVYFQHGDKLAVLRPGASSEESLADVAGHVVVLVLDAAAIYVSTQGVNPSIYRVAKVGGSATRIVDSEITPLRLAVDDVHLYFTDTEGGLVVRVPKNGGPAETVAQGQQRPVAIAVDESNVYWTNLSAGTIMKTRK
jgi:hypothetical protein